MITNFLKSTKLKPYKKIASNSISTDISLLSDSELNTFINDNISNKEIAFSVIREAAKRTLNIEPYDVQIMGALIITDGKIAEMKTGEGKTLTAGMTAVYNALLGRKVYIVTVNDYLVERDSHENKPLFDFFELSVGTIVSTNRDNEYKKEQYDCNIVYGTNSEFCFDYLKDNMVHDINDKVQPVQDFVLIDEIDSILIDEARTPLIISGQNDYSSYDLYMIDIFSKSLKEGKMVVEDYTKKYTDDFYIDRQQHLVILSEEGINKIESFFKIEHLYENHDTSGLAHIIEQALVANHIYENGLQYIIKDSRIVLIDENTGRLTEGRQLSHGLHQAIEAKENLILSPATSVLAEITYQNYFKLFETIGGMTGTIETEAKEMYEVYKLDIIEVPTNKPVIRKDKKDIIFTTKERKIKYLINLVKEINSKGQPILIGTASVTDNEILEEIFEKENIKVNVLNAKNAEIEGEIIAKAGQFGSITLTTNMAGRGVDIKLDQQSKDVGGLFVIGFERYDNRRIDNQLRGRSGRQGDPGVTQFFVSLEDRMIKAFAGSKLLNIVSNLDIDDSEFLESRMISKGIEKAQIKMEESNFESRKELVKYDQIISIQRNKIFELRDSILSPDYDFISKINELIEHSVDQVFSNGEEDKETAYNNLLSLFNIMVNDYLYLRKQDLVHMFENKIASKFGIMPPEDMFSFMRSIYLDAIDSSWIENLTNLEELRKGVGLRQINQKDPLIEFNKEAYSMFATMLNVNQLKIMKTLLHVQIEIIKEETN